MLIYVNCISRSLSFNENDVHKANMMSTGDEGIALSMSRVLAFTHAAVAVDGLSPVGKGARMSRRWRWVMGLAIAALGSVALAEGGGAGAVTTIRGNTEINAAAGSMTAVAAGSGNKAQNRVGVASGNVQGKTEINAAVGSMSTIAAGSGNTAKTNVGVVKDGKNAKVTVGVGSVSNVVTGSKQKGCINIGTKGVADCE